MMRRSSLGRLRRTAGAGLGTNSGGTFVESWARVGFRLKSGVLGFEYAGAMFRG